MAFVNHINASTKNETKNNNDEHNHGSSPASASVRQQGPLSPAIALEMNENTQVTSSSASGRSSFMYQRPRRRRQTWSSHTSPFQTNTTADRSPLVATTESTQIVRNRNRHTNNNNGGSGLNGSSQLRASLDSGMASVRRWIITCYADTSPSNMGSDPRGSNPQQYYDDNSLVEPRYFRSLIEQEEEEDFSHVLRRQRALSEPDSGSLRDFLFQRAARGTPSFRRDLLHDRIDSFPEGNITGVGAAPTVSTPATSPSSFLLSTQQYVIPSGSLVETPISDTSAVAANSNETTRNNNDGASDGVDDTPISDQTDLDPNREARTRWIRINHRFQLIITSVALLFSLLLFAILICWVIFTSAFIVSIDKGCDVPLKLYFWLASLQLALDIFRTDIMRVIFLWDATSAERIPIRVVAYNIVYLTYATLVLRLGIQSVFVTEPNFTCSDTATELFQSGRIFVILSICAWAVIILGYLVPFCFVAMLLTWNGYSPSSDLNSGHLGANRVFPSAYTDTGAPPGCINHLRVVQLEEFPETYPIECCICMELFRSGDAIVMTECDHIFHKSCCREWLIQARTCPVCRMDIPTSLGSAGSGETVSQEEDGGDNSPANSRLALTIGPAPRSFGRDDFAQEIASVFRILRISEDGRLRQNMGGNSGEEIGLADDQEQGSTYTRPVNETGQTRRHETNINVTATLEEGRF